MKLRFLKMIQYPTEIDEGRYLRRRDYFMIPDWEPCKETEKPVLRTLSFLFLSVSPGKPGCRSKTKMPLAGLSCFIAEEKGFEPLIPFRIYTLSRRAGSTTPALLRVRAAKIQSFLKYWELSTPTLENDPSRSGKQLCYHLPGLRRLAICGFSAKGLGSFKPRFIILRG